MRNSLVVTSYEPFLNYICRGFLVYRHPLKEPTSVPPNWWSPPQKKNRVLTISIGGNNLEGHDQFHLNIRIHHSSWRFPVFRCFSCLLFLFLLALFFGRTFVFLALLLFFPCFNSLVFLNDLIGLQPLRKLIKHLRAKIISVRTLSSYITRCFEGQLSFLLTYTSLAFQTPCQKVFGP